MIVVLFGPPGAGKGTQARAICEALGVPQVATGDIFRKHLKEGTELGRLARSYMDRGELVPDDVVWKLVEDRLGQPDCEPGVLLDGFPRSVRQAELLSAWLEGRGRKVDLVISLDVSDEAIIARLSGRRTCLACGATYHVESNPPRREGTCDRCGGEVVQRDDDRPEVVARRLRTYHRDTAPVLAFYEARGVVRHVDGEGTIDEVAGRIRALLA